MKRWLGRIALVLSGAVAAVVVTAVLLMTDSVGGSDESGASFQRAPTVGVTDPPSTTTVRETVVAISRSEEPIGAVIPRMVDLGNARGGSRNYCVRYVVAGREAEKCNKIAVLIVPDGSLIDSDERAKAILTSQQYSEMWLLQQEHRKRVLTCWSLVAVGAAVPDCWLSD